MWFSFPFKAFWLSQSGSSHLDISKELGGLTPKLKELFMRITL